MPSEIRGTSLTAIPDSPGGPGLPASPASPYINRENVNYHTHSLADCALVDTQCFWFDVKQTYFLWVTGI